jgi:sulfotransferase
MNKKFHFITGLPRSGSTLLSALLKQNPRFHASITDPLATIVGGIIETSQNGPGMKYEVPIERRINTVKGTIEGFYHHIDKPIIFNTNRAWTILTPQIDMIYPESKFIICVRDITRIIDSFETIHRKNPMSVNTVTGGPTGTVYSRAEALMVDEGIVGFPLSGIKQALTGNEQHKLFFIEYEQLCQIPNVVLSSLYNFLGEEPFDHDFNNIKSDWDEYDKEIGVPMHKLKTRIEYQARKFIIPPDIIQRYSNLEVWRG